MKSLCLSEFLSGSVVRFSRKILHTESQSSTETRRKLKLGPYRLQSRTRRSLSAFPMTDTELKLMAAAASIGLSKTPKTG
jgi:hypothetical protein